MTTVEPEQLMTIDIEIWGNRDGRGFSTRVMHPVTVTESEIRKLFELAQEFGSMSEHLEQMGRLGELSLALDELTARISFSAEATLKGQDTWHGPASETG